jgi:outer membrane murein-binding lipoprotein Lpp
MRRWSSLLGALVVASLVLSACGSTAHKTSTATTGATSTLSTGVTKNLVVTPAARKSIFDAGAKYHQLPTKDYVGLTPGMTYYAFDPTTDLYYAAAGMDPSPHSLKAQIGAQDDGGYNLFTMKPGKRWRVYDDGLGGSTEARCPIKIPASVLAVWDWKANSCFPPI